MSARGSERQRSEDRGQKAGRLYKAGSGGRLCRASKGACERIRSFALVLQVAGLVVVCADLIGAGCHVLAALSLPLLRRFLPPELSFRKARTTSLSAGFCRRGRYRRSRFCVLQSRAVATVRRRPPRSDLAGPHSERLWWPLLRFLVWCVPVTPSLFPPLWLRFLWPPVAFSLRFVRSTSRRRESGR